MKKAKIRLNSYARVPWIWYTLMTLCFLMGVNLEALAQTANGNAGITQAATQVKSYFDAGTSLMYAIGAVVGLVGAVKVYQKWNHGDHDTSKVAAAWFGSCVFLVIVATVLKSFFGL
ncbi:MAG TPA: DUF4134 domain-containing protein [Chitinophagaceae bacterium]|nr:DUF4134 domain-containing protein [Chitinophagaceae bacterium]